MADETKKIGLARAFRRSMTPAETLLWNRLRAKRFHALKFQRQQPLGKYIADFYCSTARLVIELDGAGHNQGRDRKRDSEVSEWGILVLRFDNDEVLRDVEKVLAQVLVACIGSIKNEIR